MRILALNWRCTRHPEAGGAELNLFRQTEHWAAGAHSVTVFCGGAAGLPRHERIGGADVRRAGGRFGVYPRAFAFLLRNRRRFDVVLDVANGIPFFAPLATRRPTTLLVHHICGDQWQSEFPRPLARVGRFLEERVMPWVYRGAVIAVSDTTRDGLRDLGVPSERLHVVFNGVDLPPAPAPTPAEPLRVVYVGRLKAYKRLELLIGAVADLWGEMPDLRLDIAGDGDVRPELEALAAAVDDRGRIRLHGFVDDDEKARLLGLATVFATPSMHEGWGLSVLEANGYGCPAVAYDVPGLSAAIRDGETGLLAADDAGFRDALRTVLGDADTRAALGAGARRWAERFSWERCASETLDILEASVS